MNKLLHIIVTPRGLDSRTLKVAEGFLSAVRKKYPSLEVDELNIATEDLPKMTIKMVDGKYSLLGGKDMLEEQKNAWKPIVEHIERFLSADGYLISTPMWNFSIPYTLKQYIDIIVQPKYTFRYIDKNPEGLAKNKKMLVISSRGGDYSTGTPAHAYDFIEPYLSTVFGFIGIKDIVFINAQPMDAAGLDVMREKVEKARKEAIRIGKAW